MNRSELPRRAPRNRAQSKFAAAIEQLESRTLLTAVVVTTPLDNPHPAGLVSLRDAFITANASATPTTITFSPAVFSTPKTITLTAGTQLGFNNVAEPLTILGPAAPLTLSGNNVTRIMRPQPNTTLSVSNLTFINGAAQGTTFPSDRGGAVETSGRFVATNCLFRDNNARWYGGAINGDGGSILLINDTFYHNSSGGAGGAISTGGVTITLKDVTITNNKSSVGGGINCNPNSGTPFKVANTVVAGNIHTSAAGGDAFGPFVSLGNNFIGNKVQSTGWISTDFLGTPALPLNPKLGALASNGGPTQTVLPLPGSPLINAGSNVQIPAGTTVDQRGLPRIAGSFVDIGAVEIQNTGTITPPANQTGAPGAPVQVILGSFKVSSATGPFKDTISWGDGSANTILTLPGAGSIPTTGHTFAKSGTWKITEAITDAAGYLLSTISFTDTIGPVVSMIGGTVFDDVNANGTRDPHEAGLGLFTLTLNLNGKKVASTNSNILGAFSFGNPQAGTYSLVITPVTGFAVSSAGGSTLSILLGAGQSSLNNLFGEHQIV